MPAWDNARHSREGAIGTGFGLGFGLGLSWTKGSLTATGILAAPLLEGARVRFGGGIVQMRVDVKGW